MKSTSISYRWPAAVAAGLFGAAPRVAHACAMCGLPPGDHQAHAYNTSVLFMMAVPYSIVAGTILGLYLAYRTGKSRRQASATPVERTRAPGRRSAQPLQP